MSAPVLGIDPGHSGAAVLLDAGGRRVGAALSWHRLPRVGGEVYLCTSLSGDEQEEPSLHEVSRRIAAEIAGAACLSRDQRMAYDLSAPWYHLAVEGLFARPGLALHGVCSLAEAAGEVMGPLRAAAISVDRPKASSWRSEVLPKRWGTTSKEAERTALLVCRALYPTLGAFLDGSPGKDGALVPTWPHVVEAACIAAWGAAQARGAAQANLIPERSSGRRR